MSKLLWDQTGKRRYETGVDQGVLYLPNSQGDYVQGIAWNGLVTVTESPSGAEPSPQYADNIKYLNLMSAEEFNATIEAFTYPDEFAECDGTAIASPGVMIGQQPRRTFGLSYRTRVGTDVSADAGYKRHLVYGALAAPSEKAYTTVNDSPEAITFSWELSTTPVEVPGFKPSAILTIDSTGVPPEGLAALEDALHGTAGTDPRLPLPVEVLAFFAGSVETVTAVAPTYNATTKVITIPSVTGVTYQIDGKNVATGPTAPITKDTLVTAKPNSGYRFSAASDDDWAFSFTA